MDGQGWREIDLLGRCTGGGPEGRLQEEKDILVRSCKYDVEGGCLAVASTADWV